jgi:RHS repeat-associated protein
MIRAGGATIIVSRQTSGTNSVHYVTRDHLGSSSAVTNGAGGVLMNSSFDAFGKRRGANWTGSPSAGDWTAIAGTTRRGYTDHTMLDNLDLIHMNGRVQDPVLGRFASADPYITEPGFTQNFNRYSYVYNNPFSYIDPSGFECVVIKEQSFPIYIPAGATAPGGISGTIESGRLPEQTFCWDDTRLPSTGGDNNGASPQEGCSDQKLLDIGGDVAGAYEKGFESAALIGERSALQPYNAHQAAALNHGANQMTRVARGFGALDLGLTYAAMRSAYNQNDMTGAISHGVDLGIDGITMLVPGWGGIVSGAACDVANCGRHVGQAIGPPVQFMKDYQGVRSLIALAHGQSAFHQPNSAGSVGCKP